MGSRSWRYKVPRPDLSGPSAKSARTGLMIQQLVYCILCSIVAKGKVQLYIWQSSTTSLVAAFAHKILFHTNHFGPRHSRLCIRTVVPGLTVLCSSLSTSVSQFGLDLRSKALHTKNAFAFQQVSARFVPKVLKAAMNAETRESPEETSPTELSTMADPSSSRITLSRRSSFTVPDDDLTRRPRFEPIDLRALQYVGSYDHNLMCPICHCPFVSPVKLDCEHVFCQYCVNQAIRHQNRNARSCPSCRGRIAESSITTAPQILNRILDELLVKCPQSREGCLEEVPRCRVQDHVLKYCSFSQVDCPSEECLLTVRRRDTDGDRCLHYRVECEDCKHLVMKKDLEAHHKLECEVGRTSCPDCKDQVLVRDFKSHIDRCPDVICPCAAAPYGCDFSARRTSLDEHLEACPLAKLMPFLKMQNERLDAHEVVLKHLRHKNSILETSFCTIRDTLSPSATLIDTSLPGAEPPDTAPFDSTAHHLLSLHESLREEVSRVSTAISEIDAKASMMAMNERLRAKEDLAHTNAAIGGMRMQLHWLVSAKLQNQQRVAMIRTQSSGDGIVVDSSSASMDPGNGSSIPIRRLSDSTRQVTKL